MRIKLNILQILDSANERFSPFRLKGVRHSVGIDGRVEDREVIVAWEIIDLDDGLEGKIITNNKFKGIECGLLVDELNREHKIYNRELINYLFDSNEIVISL